MPVDESPLTWQVPAAVHEHEYLIKKSRFIARVVPVSDREQVNTALRRARLDYPDAGHHCWAYLFGKPQDAGSAGMSDDGEPAGTAGRPILNVLQHGHLGDVLVIVSRYFGGIKLGAGGLVRAYGTATQLALATAPASLRRELKQMQVLGEFSAEQPLRHWLAAVGGEVDSVTYSEVISVALTLPAEQLTALESFCAARQLQLEDPEKNL